MKIKTAADIKKITPPAKGNERHPVDGCPGLNLKVTAKGWWAWTFRCRPRKGPKAGVGREYTIGDYPVFGFGLARERWKELRRRVKDEEDPLGQIEEAREAPDMRELILEGTRHSQAHLLVAIVNKTTCIKTFR